MVFGNNYDGSGGEMNAASGSIQDFRAGRRASSAPEPGRSAAEAGNQDYASMWSRELVLTHATGPYVGTAASVITADINGFVQFGSVCDPQFTFVTLPSTASKGARAFASNGRKPAEAAGAGTGVAVFFDGTHWISVCSGVAVTA